MSLAFDPLGQFLLSGSDDATLTLWNVATVACFRVFRGHTAWVRSVAFSSDGKTIASGSGDETVKLWSVETGECLKTLRRDRPYEGMNITSIKGLTEAEKATLEALGAIEN